MSRRSTQSHDAQKSGSSVQARRFRVVILLSQKFKMNIRAVLKQSSHVFASVSATEAPVALFYDLDLWETVLDSCQKAFPPHFRHYIAAKANPLTKMLARAHNKGFGVECASIGELLLATEHLGIDDVVFDSPAKTRAELRLALERNVRCHLDNFDEFERAKEMIDDRPRPLGFRINPCAGEGEIKALSVSTPDSKFGVNINERDRLLDLYVACPFLTSVHVHVGSGKMGVAVLAAGIKAVVDFALEVNSRVEGRITHIDIGGGLAVDYTSDDLPDFQAYAQVLRDTCPALFSGEFQVLTEFGQSLNAKAGFLASRVEFVKNEPARSSRLAIIHFGADCCVRQAYSTEHKRRFEFFDHDAEPLPRGTEYWSIGGPLCFQGDFVARDIIGPPDDLKPGDFVVMKDAGSNTVSMFSRHCSRFAPPVFGYRVEEGGNVDLVELKPRETLASLADFWSPPADGR